MITPPPLELVRKADEVFERLLAFYGLPEWREPLPPLDELVSTILSQNTNDNNRDTAYRSLRHRFSTWEAVRDAPVEEVIEAIRPAGLAKTKAPRIQNVLREISAERGDLSLDFLRDMDPHEAHAWLLKFKGVGPKTAAIVMQFSLNRPAFPVDTHIYRVSGRLGLRPADITVEEAHGYLSALFSPEDYGPAHLNLIRHGREICQARRPLCGHCPITDLCDYYKNLP
jgi:endonuclease-3